VRLHGGAGGWAGGQRGPWGQAQGRPDAGWTRHTGISQAAQWSTGAEGGTGGAAGGGSGAGEGTAHQASAAAAGGVYPSVGQGTHFLNDGALLGSTDEKA
jgi:hypothetical protein